MRILVTGGTGRIGKATTERLLQNGWDVRVLDRAAGVEIPGAEYVQGDILDYDSLLNHTRGCDSIIHLAAIPSPYGAPGHDVFQINAAGTFNVFEAAAKLGIKRVVQASSINALGAFYHLGEIHPQYFPIDEAHPRLTTDPYSFSKEVIEDIGDYYWRREGISSVAMRFPGVYSKGYAQSENYLQKRNTVSRAIDELVSLPESEQRARLAAVHQRAMEFRSMRPFEFQPDRNKGMLDGIFEDPLFGSYIADRFNYWVFVDERDAAQSLEKGVTADYEGAHPLFINDDYNYLGYEARTLARVFFPEVADFKRDLPGSAALVSIEKARALIGFEPEYSIGN
jgi:nucleoside-diphosphate-sugar epimerase